MNRTFFIQLLLIIVLIVLLCQLSLLGRLFDLWRPHMEAIEKHRAHGVVELLVEQIDHLAEPEQRHYLRRVQKDFGYELALTAKSDISLSDSQLDELNNGSLVFNKERLEIYRQLHNGQLLVIENMDAPAQHLQSDIEQAIIGSIKLLQRLLKEADESDWQLIVEQVSLQDGVKIQLLDMTKIDLNSQAAAQLNEGEKVYIESAGSQSLELPADVIYQRIGESKKVLKIGPISPFIDDLIYRSKLANYALLSVLITLPIILWFLPTWISARNLNRAKRKLGEGENQARISPVLASNLNPLVPIFNQMAENIEHSLAYNKVLTHAISHELRTPITNIGFALELFEVNSSQDNRNKQLNRMKASIQELEEMASELSDYTRFDQGRLNLDLQKNDVGVFLVKAIDKWQTMPSKIVLSATLHPSPYWAKFDPYFLGRAIDNLLRNGFVYADSRIHIYLEQTISGCRICFENDGRPIPVADRNQLFAPFVRLNDSRDRDSGGTGLGLAIVAQIVEAHEGQVWIEDSALGGAKFVIQLSACIE